MIQPHHHRKAGNIYEIPLTWFAAKGWTPFPFQREAWDAYLRGESGLIHAPTGTGKTYAAWLGVVAEYLVTHPNRSAQTTRAKSPPLQALWITPLRALAADTEKSLRAPLDDLGVGWSIETRTGDTSSTVRARQRTRLPSALVTTPESLSLLLARDNAADLFSDLKLVVVDEWHELLTSKRGTQTELGLARLRRWRPDLRIWGLSATMGDLDLALRTLIGAVDYHAGEIKPGHLIQGELPKAITIESIIPDRIERFPWAGHLGLNLLTRAIDVIAGGRSALVFTNTRSQTEMWYQAILSAKPEWAGEIALHHGSLDRETREWVEEGLRDGRLRCVVCTSSLDLGVDFSPVDVVIQVGSPKGIARLLQRAGRSGHQPGAESKVICLPTNALELVEVAAVREAASEGLIESRPPVRNALDVLAQHMVTVALGGGFVPDDLFREVKTTVAYRELSRLEFDWTLDFVSRGGEALRAYPEYTRITEQDGRYIVDRTDIARTHRMSIGTILSDATLKVQFIRGPAIGYVEEAFIARLQRGDKFTLGGRVLEFDRVREMTAWVRLARGRQGIVPRWYGGGLPLSAELTAAVRDKLDQARNNFYDAPEMQAVRPILELQAKWSRIPAPDELLIERVKTREGYHLFFYPFGGWLVHEGLAALFAYRMARLQPITFSIAVNDFGFELLAPEPAPLDQALESGLFSAETLADDILHSLNAAEMAKRQFREIARIAGLVMQRFPGGQKSAKQMQASSGLLYDVFAKYDPDNRLLEQARREVLERQLEIGRLKATLDQINAGQVSVIDVKRPTPFAFPLMIERVRGTLTSEKLSDRILKLQTSLERAAEKER